MIRTSDSLKEWGNKSIRKHNIDRRSERPLRAQAERRSQRVRRATFERVKTILYLKYHNFPCKRLFYSKSSVGTRYFRSEYRVRYRPSTQYAYVDGRFVPSPGAAPVSPPMDPRANSTTNLPNDKRFRESSAASR